LRIVNPSFGLTPAGAEQVTTRPVDWLADPIVMFTNSKPNARELLEGVRAKLGALRPIDNIGFLGKNSASQPAPGGVVDQVAQNYRIALIALGD
jgi:hypothetical protein